MLIKSHVQKNFTGKPIQILQTGKTVLIQKNVNSTIRQGLKSGSNFNIWLSSVFSLLQCFMQENYVMSVDLPNKGNCIVCTNRKRLRRSIYLFFNSQAVLAGDFILSAASLALARIGNTTIISVLTQVIEDLVRGKVFFCFYLQICLPKQ